MTFKDLGLIEPILKAVNDQGYTSPTPIQEQSIPILLKKKDLLGCAQTGTGKTAAFTIPILQHLATERQTSQRRLIKALIVTPTRELALQINESIKDYGKYTKLKSTVIFGGVKQGAQVNALKQGVDILVATPGRLLDLMSQGFISLRDVDFFVLDEADQMLDMGFIHDIKKLLVKLPKERQSLFFSATMPQAIVQLSSQILGNYEKVTIKPQQTTAEKVGQSLYMVSKADKIQLLVDIIEDRNAKSVLVFSRTKHGANKVVTLLERQDINAAAIHG
ncbi:MAG: DEAD/DEAH box helicase, partial [Flavobacteriales bacterium]|nr:DEAD/DEAH box helicase [Flavobacteriales bacterium]